MDVVENEPVGASQCYDVFRERQGVIQGQAKVLCTLGRGHPGVLERSWIGQTFPGRKSSSILSRLSLRADVQAEISARHARGKEKRS
jgi:hypothetical protein